MASRLTGLRAAATAMLTVMIHQGAAAQSGDEASCGALLTEQLRRFSEKCLSDLAAFVASEPEMAARVAGEKERFYVTLTRTDDGLLAEAVSKFNYPLMKADTPDLLKQLGWAPPENELDNWKRVIRKADIANGGAGQELTKALAAYGLNQGEAISLTVAPKLSDKPT